MLQAAPDSSKYQQRVNSDSQDYAQILWACNTKTRFHEISTQKISLKNAFPKKSMKIKNKKEYLIRRKTDFPYLIDIPKY